MCGIAGAVGHLDAELFHALARASERQRHRGPDSEGFWASDPEGASGAAFAHRRLAIIDLSERGRQPMLDPRTGNAICFNGEIYNFRELRRELSERGCEFRSDCDTEVVLHAYGVWGGRCVRRLRGMFAFAVWDAEHREVFLARDRLGIKPLYVAEVARSGGRPALLFASELRALLATGLVDARLDPGSLAGYLWNGFVVGPRTIVRDVRLLDPGSTARVSAAGEVRDRDRFWSLPRAVPAATSLDDLGAALADAVRLRLMSDVPLGVFLSGGIDSSAVASLAVRGGSERVKTFNVCFEEAEYDESPHARRVAAALGAEHTEIHLTQSRFRALLDEALAGLDQPSFDGVNTYVVSRAVREAGITVALSGLGGDELFGGYSSFAELPRARAAARLASALPPRLRRAFAQGVTRLKTGEPGEVPPQTRWGKLADLLATEGDLVGLYQTSYALFSRDFVAELAAPLPDAGLDWGLPAGRGAELRDWSRGQPLLAALSGLELACFVGERLLRDTDSVSMAVSLEVRVPLIDHEVVELAAGLDTGLRYRPLGRKSALRRIALDGLEPDLFERPKAGFVLPIDRWIRDALKSELEQVLTDRGRCRDVGLEPEVVARLWRAYQAGAPGMYWSRVWAIFVLLRWARRHGASL